MMSPFIRASFIALTLLVANGCGAFFRSMRTVTRPHQERSIGIEGAINVSSGEAPTPTPGFQGGLVYRRNGWRVGLGGRATARIFAPIPGNGDPLSVESVFAEATLCRAWEHGQRPRFVACGIVGAGSTLVTRITRVDGWLVDGGPTAASRLRLSLEIPLGTEIDRDGGAATGVLFAGVEGSLHIVRTVIATEGAGAAWEQPLLGWTVFLGARVDGSF